MSLQNINTYTYSPGFQIGQYHNAVLCISGNVQNLYLDGTLIATKTGTANVLANYSTINQIMIGCAGDKSSGFSGYLDDFRMYNYTLNQAQVSNLYINRNIVAYYPFDNSLNSQTPNYATLTYDATFVGNAATISTATDTYLIGNGALQLTNSNTAGSIKSYVTSSSGFSTSTTNGLSVSLWFKASGVSSTRMRLFDLCTALGSQGISVDISGTNQILAGNGYYNAPVVTSFTDLTTITGLKLWLDANSSSNFTTSAGNIVSWNDKSGLGNNATTASTQVTRTVTSNNNNTVNVGNGGTLNLNSSLTLQTPFTVFIVTQPIPCINGANLFLYSNSSAAFYIAQFGSQRLDIGLQGGNGGFSGNTNTFTTTSLVILTLQVNYNTSYVMNINGTSSGSLNISYTPPAGSNYFISGGNPGMNISEMIYYNTVLTSANYQKVEGYLAWKWGLQTSLPTSHPHYNSPPSI